MKKLLALFVCAMFLFGCSSNSSTTVKNGDYVKIDFTGTMDGVAFDGGSATNQGVEIGLGQYIEGFEEGIIGMKKGETKDVKLTFPDNYYEELAGKEVTFKITVNKIFKEME